VAGWRAYVGSYACGLIAALAVYCVAGFVIITSAARVSPAGLAFWLVFCPVMAAVLAFGLVHGTLAGARFGMASTAGTATFCGAFTVTAVVLIMTDTLEEPFAALLLVTVLFFGGRYLMKRGADV
jgi:uncharacterized PurR-regulated membrane protein YhhQ (DUF165 family)